MRREHGVTAKRKSRAEDEALKGGKFAGLRWFWKKSCEVMCAAARDWLVGVSQPHGR